MSTPVEQLTAALDLTGRLVAAVGPDEWAGPTPCTEWTVRDLVAHIVGGNHRTAAALAGEPGVAAADAPPAGDLTGAYEASAAALRAAASRPGVLEATVALPFGEVPGAVALQLRMADLLTHGWDLAQALGRPFAVPEDLAETSLAFSRSLLATLPGGAPFDPPQPVADDAPAIDRLAALLGRRLPVG